MKLGKPKSLLEGLKECKVEIFLRKETDIGTQVDWSPSQMDTMSLIFPVKIYEHIKVSKRPNIPEWEWEKKIELADYPPLDPFIFCKKHILSQINEKRDELGPYRINHDMNLDSISNRYNELQLASNLDEASTTQLIRKEFNLSDTDFGKGKDLHEN